MFCISTTGNHISCIVTTQRAKFMRPTWDPPGPCRPQMGPMLAPWTLLSGHVYSCDFLKWYKECLCDLDDLSFSVDSRPGTSEVPAQMASYAENVSIWWRHHESWYAPPSTYTPSGTFTPIYERNHTDINPTIGGGKQICSQIARFMGPTWDPPGADRTQVGPMLVPWTLLSGFGQLWMFSANTSSVGSA